MPGTNGCCPKRFSENLRNRRTIAHAAIFYVYMNAEDKYKSYSVEPFSTYFIPKQKRKNAENAG